jgi:hypothetical protein
MGAPSNDFPFFVSGLLLSSPLYLNPRMSYPLSLEYLHFDGGGIEISMERFGHQ